MSTRCHIRVKDADGKLHPCMIYKHSDGYPSGTLPFLEGFTKKFWVDRRDDCQYFIAQYLIQNAIAEEMKAIQEANTDRRALLSRVDDFCGFGVCLTLNPHGDVEYMYTVDLNDGTIKCEKV